MDHYMKSERNVNVWDCSTLFVLICHVLIDVTRCGSSCRGYKYVKYDLAGGSSYRGFELPRAKLFKQIVRPGFNRRSLRVHDFEDGKAPRQSLEILFYQNQCSSKLNYHASLHSCGMYYYIQKYHPFFSKDCHFGRPQFAFITDLLNDLNNDLGM